MSASSLNVGIVGAGSRGVKCFGKLFSQRKDAVVTAICDPNPVRAKEQANGGIFPSPPTCYGTVEDMLAGEELDAVVITSPDYCHEANAVAALNGGVHCLIDKPLATTAAGCMNIIAASKAAGKTAMVGFNLRHQLVLKRLKQLIEEGALGNVFLIENREFYMGGRTYMARWNRRYEWSGGLWVHKGSHDFDIFNWLLDFPRPARVSSFAGINVFKPEGLPFEMEADKPVGPTCRECAYASVCRDCTKHMAPEWTGDARDNDGYAKDLCMYMSDKDTHDNGFAIVEYENGVRASHMECFVTSMSDRLYTVVGDRGTAEVSLHNRTIVIRPRWTGEVITHQVPAVSGGHGGADPGLVDTFVEVVRNGGPAPSTLEHGLLSTSIGQAAEIARRENRVVHMTELLGAS